ncbi:glycoside hydrolase family 2 TIM barrel-domain containing protein [Nakamurella endophytica]|uniref:Glycoside hydrolase family 2 n=1 Tax=Nakamurella endophytica TaxID=1748367 RepID=A0A917SNQ4_9ACTN|nr:glycoside hydrolase family 2 TIM barrel-domain containing protein [Nakamurella endophytica]GGL89973.1 hypothetical protein GCM10011594_07050 [Nakamurella endophytica]
MTVGRAGTGTTAVGGWTIAADPDDTGVAERWFETPPATAVPIAVPGPLQAAFPGQHGLFWYWATVAVPPRADGYVPVLVLDAVGHQAHVWWDGERLPGVAIGPRTEFRLAGESGGRTVPVAIRVLNPTGRRIDGVVLADTASSNASDEDAYQPGRMYNYGGLLGPVRLVHRPLVDIADVLVDPDPSSGSVRVQVEVRNDTGGPVTARCSAVVGERDGVLDRSSGLVDVGPGAVVTVGLDLQVPDPEPWSPDRPRLYDVRVRLAADGARIVHPGAERLLRTGFRSFRIDDRGRFELNGQPLFVRSTHTGNHVPPGLPPERAAALLRQDLLHAKAVGLNMVRFIASLATPEQLDLCDEIGLLVYAESRASWPHGTDPVLREVFDREWDTVLRRDRNHPCVVVWGLLNETRDGTVFRHAAGSLPALRGLDPTRLVLLGSGRWDGDLSVGSYSNPGGTNWETGWGAEDVAAERPSDPSAEIRGGYVPRVGDRHYYPRVPHDRSEADLLRTMGQDGPGPVFLSEYGVGSLLHLELEDAELRELGIDPRLAEPALIADMRRRYHEDFERWELDRVLASPRDLFDESQRLSARWRNQSIGLLRANPRIVGHNVTGMLDHAVSGEGLWTFAGRHLKPGMVDALRDALAPVRWCLVPSAWHQIVGAPAHIDVVLATERPQPAGQHRVGLTLSGPRGPVHRTWLECAVPPEQAFAVPLGRVDIPVDLPAGSYTVVADCATLPVPAGRTVTIHRSNPCPAPRIPGLITAGLDAGVESWLHAGDPDVRPSAHPDLPRALVERQRPGLVLLGHDAALPAPDRARLLDAVRSGSRVVVLAQGSLSAGVTALLADLGTPWTYEPVHDWLYHGEVVTLPHPVFDREERLGVLDWNRYEELAPRGLLRAAATPDERAAVYLAAGMPVPGGYRSGEILAGWAVGAGSVLATTFRFDRVGSAPAQQRLLAALLRHAA